MSRELWDRLPVNPCKHQWPVWAVLVSVLQGTPRPGDVPLVGSSPKRRAMHSTGLLHPQIPTLNDPQLNNMGKH